MKQRILTTGILAVFLLSLAGCAYRLHYRVSTATSSTGKTINYSRIDFPDVSLHIRLFNDICTHKASIFPLKKEEPDLGFYRYTRSYDTNEEFRVLIGILPGNSGYSLDAKRITLLVDNVEVSVSGLEGPIRYFPYTSFAFPKNWDKTQLRKKAEQGYIFSFPSEEGGIRNSEDDDLVVEASQIDLWTCFELIFDCPTPSPDRSLKLKVEGLRRAGNTIDIPLIEFRESLYKDRGQNI